MTSHPVVDLIPDYRRAYLPPMLLGAAAGLACLAAAGFTLGFFLGGVVMISLLVPPLVAGQDRLVDRLLAAGGIVDGAAVVALSAVFRGACSLGQWLQLYLLGLAVSAMLMAFVQALVASRIDRWLAAGVAVIIALAWLLWPVWLSPVLTPALADWLTPCHPLFATNAIVRHLGLWSEQAGVVYHLTSLNQDMPHRLPDSPWPAVAAHLLLAGMLVVFGWLMPGRETRMTRNQNDESMTKPG